VGPADPAAPAGRLTGADTRADLLLAADLFLQGMPGERDDGIASGPVGPQVIARVADCLGRRDRTAVASISQAVRLYRHDPSWRWRLEVIDAVTMAAAPPADGGRAVQRRGGRSS
jgi:hypothetical protein